MKKWRTPLLLVLATVALVAIAGGAWLLQPSGQAEAGVLPAESLSCSAVSPSSDALTVASDSPGMSLLSTDTPALSATCYFVGITIFTNGCGSKDLYVLRYLCYDPARGWYYVNYYYCA